MPAGPAPPECLAGQHLGEFGTEIETVENKLLKLLSPKGPMDINNLLVRAQYVLHFSFPQHRIHFEWPENPPVPLDEQFSRSSQYFARRE